MYWEESECAWSYKPTITKSLSGFSQNSFRMKRRFVDPSTDKSFGYWQQRDTSFGMCKNGNEKLESTES